MVGSLGKPDLPDAVDLRQKYRLEGIEVTLPTTTVIPLGFIVSELVTDAVKYGKAGLR